MKTAVSIPDDLFVAADELAAKLDLPRSKLYAQALSEFLDRQDDEQITKQLNEVYAQQSSALDPGLHRLQVESANSQW